MWEALNRVWEALNRVWEAALCGSGRQPCAVVGGILGRGGGRHPWAGGGILGREEALTMGNPLCSSLNESRCLSDHASLSRQDA